MIKIKKVSSKLLLKNIEKRIKKVKGDFRQKEILKLWQKHLLGTRNTKLGFWTASFEVKCSSGTYVRAIANDLGVKIGVPSLALVIKRTKIGKWSKGV